jgi:NADH-quinone oxidoreductase subunit M
MALVMFASFGIPGLAHFAAEVQIVLGALGGYRWAAVGMLVGVLVTTAMFLWTLQRVLLGQLPEQWATLPELTARELATMLSLVVLIILLGILPGPLVGLIEAALRTGPLAALARGG